MANLDKLLEEIFEVSEWSHSNLPKPNLYQNLRELKRAISQNSLYDILASLNSLESKLVEFWVSQGQCPNCEYPLYFKPEIGYADYGDLVGLNPFQGQQVAKCPDCGWEES